jgi:glutathione S-transferase
MDLYFSPLACSLASRIVVYEANLENRVNFIMADINLRNEAYSELERLNPIRQVPVLGTDGGEILTENAAVLTFLGEMADETSLAPRTGIDRYRLSQWLCFIGTEVHKAVFTPLLSTNSNEGAKAFARGLARTRLSAVNEHLARNNFLLPQFSVADAYLFVVLNWATFATLDLSSYSHVRLYLDNIRMRESVSRALNEELALHAARQ